MKFGKILALLAVFGAVACTASTNDEPTRRRSSNTPGDLNNDGDGDQNPGGGLDNGIVVVEISSTSDSQVVGNNIDVTAKVWLDAEKTKPVTDGTNVTISFSPTSNLSVSGGSGQTSSGKFTVTVSATAEVDFEAEATSLGVTTDPIDLAFTLLPEAKANKVVVSATRSSVTVADPNSNNDQTTINIDVDDDKGQPWQGPITILASDGSLSEAAVSTDANGKASVTYSASTRLGEATITVVAGNNDAEGTTKITVGPGAPLTVEAVSVVPAQIGIRGSGSAESSLVTFRIVDQFGNPVSDSTLVTFSIEPKAYGATINPTTGGLNTVGGMVSPVLKSGFRSGTVRVIAKVTTPLSPTPISASSLPISIFGGLGDAKRISLSVEPVDKVQSGFMLTGLEASFSLRLTDWFGNPVMPGTSVKVYCEAGGCGSNNPEGITTDQNGVANFSMFSDFSWNVWDSGTDTVLDFPGGIGTDHAWPALGQQVDGEVDVVAVVQGRSSWDDANGDGTYNVGETVTKDPSEPFIDVNSNNTRDTSPFEYWEDFQLDGLVNSHMVSGTWDDHAAASYHDVQYIWSSNKVIWSTYPPLQVVPDSMVDTSIDGIFDIDEDRILLGNPITATTNFYYGFASTTETTVYVYFGDTNRNGLPAGSKLSAVIKPSTVASLVEVVMGPAEFAAGDRNGRFEAITLQKKTPSGMTAGYKTFVLELTAEVPDLGVKYFQSVRGSIY